MNETEAFRQYLQERKQSPKINYHLEALKEMERVRKKNDQKPTLLLHACCIVCACWPLDFLHDTFDVTVLFHNPNIWPEEEYDLRLSEFRRYLKERWNDEIPLIETPYQGEEFMKSLSFGKDHPEGWKRCFFCYEERMRYGFAMADRNGYDYFTTVMTFSRQKDSQKFNEIGARLQKEFRHTRYFFSDFKKDNGQLKSKAICEAYNLYRQNYCGCIYSMLNQKGNSPDQRKMDGVE